MQEEGRLKTPGLLLSSVELAHAVTPRAPGSLPQRSKASAVSAIRESLDRGQGVSFCAAALVCLAGSQLNTPMVQPSLASAETCSLDAV